MNWKKEKDNNPIKVYIFEIIGEYSKIFVNEEKYEIREINSLNQMVMIIRN